MRKQQLWSLFVGSPVQAEESASTTEGDCQPAEEYGGGSDYSSGAAVRPGLAPLRACRVPVWSGSRWHQNRSQRAREASLKSEKSTVKKKKKNKITAWIQS